MDGHFARGSSICCHARLLCTSGTEACLLEVGDEGKIDKLLEKEAECKLVPITCGSGCLAVVSCNTRGGLRAKICQVDLWMAQLENVLSEVPQGQVLGLESFEQAGLEEPCVTHWWGWDEALG